MGAKDYEGMQCPHCKHKESQLKAMLQVLKCSHCQSTFILTYVDDLDKGRRVFLGQRYNPAFFDRVEQLYSEGKDWAEVFLSVEEEGVPLYTPPLYVLGYKDYRDATS